MSHLASSPFSLHFIDSVGGFPNATNLAAMRAKDRILTRHKTLAPKSSRIRVSDWTRREYTVSLNKSPAPFQARTHTCGQLSAADNGSRVILGGWLLPER